MDVVTAARSLIADTLAFHINFATLGIALRRNIEPMEAFES